MGFTSTAGSVRLQRSPDVDELRLTFIPGNANQAGTIQVACTLAGGGEVRGEKSYSFQMSETDRDLIRRYLEEFPIQPDKAVAIAGEGAIRRTGEALFREIFDHPGTKPPYEALRSSPASGRVVIEAGIEGAAVPWELMRDPFAHGAGELVLHFRGFYRTVPSPAPQGALPTGNFTPPAGGKTPLRILLVVCRPEGKDDVRFQSIARVLQIVARDFQRRIQIDVLRPPTFEDLDRHLGNHAGQYHVVHFDGHGELEPDDQGGGRGVLLFEEQGGGPRRISGEDLGRLLSNRGVPAAILNACQSGMALPRAAVPSLAQQVLEAGVPAVLAMSYNVLVDAAERFVKRLYERILRGDTLDTAVHEGRWLLRNEPLRPTAFGDVELRDWIVPVLFQSAPLLLFDPSLPGEPSPSPTAVERTPLPKAVDGLIGRDGAFLDLERALASQEDSKSVLIVGEAGIGKTATAVGFARWWAATGGSRTGQAILYLGGETWSPSTLCDAVGDAFSREEQQALLAGEYHGLDQAGRCEAALRLVQKAVGVLVIDNVAGLEGSDGPDEDRRRATEFAHQFLNRIKATGVLLLLAAERIPPWLQASHVVPLQPLAATDAGTLIGRVRERYHLSDRSFTDRPGCRQLCNVLQERGRPGEILVCLAQLTTQRSPADVLSEIRLPPSSRSQRLWECLVIFAFALFTITLISLTPTYLTGGDEWARMFNDVYRHPDEDSLDRTPSKGVTCLGFFLELVRGLILIVVGFIWLPGLVFRDGAGRLLNFGPFRDPELESPDLGVVLCWAIFIALGVALGVNVTYHHFWEAPPELWKSRGFRSLLHGPYKGPLEPRKEIPSPKDPLYKDYYQSCIVPYIWYYPYSLIYFVFVESFIFVLGLYSVGLDLYRCHQRFTSLGSVLRAPDAVWSSASHHFNEWRRTLRELLEKYYSLLMFGAFGIWFIFWFDQYNLIPEAAANARRALLFLMLPLMAFLLPILWNYSASVEMARELVPEADRGRFTRRNHLIAFLWSTMARSRYFWWVVLFGVAGIPCWYLFVVRLHWL
jgi:hypothetical protein